MQVSQRVTAAATLISLPFQALPSPALDQETMVVLPTSPSSLRGGSPNDSPYIPIVHLPTPVTPDNDGTETLSSTQPKRNLKSHVASACTNCKKGHLACDVSRPCKRCISSGKADGCQDVKQRKRGRPRLNDTKRLNSVYGGSVNLGETDEEGNGIARAFVHTIPAARKISFVHEPIESFREQKGLNQTEDLLTQILPMHRIPPPQPVAFLSPQPRDSTTHPRQHLPLPPASTTIGAITLFLSMEMCCARVSDDVTLLWGYEPSDLVHQSLYGFISSHDTDRLGRLHRLLLDNIMDIACQQDASLRKTMRPPPSEHTTSPLFYETDIDRLCLAANGSSTFMDTLHIKKQSGECELYEVLVYLGSAFGADLTRTSTLDRLYVVAELKRHQYKVKPEYFATSNFSQQQQQEEHPQRSQLSPRNINSNGTSSLLQKRTQRPLAPQFSRHGKNSNNRNLLQVRQGSLPVHFAANCQLNTVSLPVTRKSNASKVNVAPMTGEKKGSKITDRLFPSLGDGPQFCRITTANSTTSPSHINSHSSMAYRIGLIVSGRMGSPSRATPSSITHPTTQYFLQTSSSTLNVAASAVQRNMQHSTSINSTTENGGKTGSSQKAEMSVRSLLC